MPALNKGWSQAEETKCGHPHPTCMVGDHFCDYGESFFSSMPGLSDKPSLWTYRELKRSLDMTKASPGEFSVCFTKLQQNFFNHHPSKLKDLILLVKAWYQQVSFKLYISAYHPFPLVQDQLTTRYSTTISRTQRNALLCIF